MFRLFLCALFSIFLVGCQTTGEVSQIQKKAFEVKSGMNKEQVTEILGTPGNRSFKDQNEAWQYCQTGMWNDTYVIVWFRNNKVEGLSNFNDTADFLCSGNFKAVDWTQRPQKGGDVNVNVNVNVDHSSSNHK